MATGSRTLKLAILAETKQLVDNLKSAEKDVQTFGDKMGDIGKKVGLAFAAATAAAGAYAIKIGVDGVKSAIEDEAAQLRLASALRSATGATDDQIKATEDYISKTQLATGVTDTDLRNSFQRLAVTTKDVGSSQKLLNLALDVSKGSGKDLATVTEALAKSYEGQDAKLAKLGIGLSAADLKAMDFTQTQIALSNLYGGAAAENAETFQGRIDRLRQGFEEAKESIGEALLPIIEKMIGYIFQYGVPIVNKFRDAWDVVKNAIDKNRENFKEFIDLLQTYVLPILGKVFSFLVDVGGKAAAFIINTFGAIAGAITPVINFIIDAINLVIRGLNIVKPGSDIGYLNGIGSSSIDSFRSGERGDITGTTAVTPSIPAIQSPSFAPVTGGASGSSAGVDASNVFGKALGVIGNVGYTVPSSYYSMTGRDAPGSYQTPMSYNITINGAIDPVGTARTINSLIQNEASTAGAFIGFGGSQVIAPFTP